MGNIFRNIGYVISIILTILCILGMLINFFEFSRTNEKASANIISYVVAPFLFLVLIIITCCILMIVNLIDGQSLFYDFNRFIRLFGYSGVGIVVLFFLSLLRL